MAQSRSASLLTNRGRTGVAVGLTAFAFALAVRDVLLGSQSRKLLLPVDLLLHGWPLVAVNLGFYAYLCWLAFWFVRGTQGRERVFMIGWFSAILLPPLGDLQHGFSVEIRYLCALGLAVSLVLGVSLFLNPTSIDNRATRNA